MALISLIFVTKSCQSTFNACRQSEGKGPDRLEQDEDEGSTPFLFFKVDTKSASLCFSSFRERFMDSSSSTYSSILRAEGALSKSA